MKRFFTILLILLLGINFCLGQEMSKLTVNKNHRIQKQEIENDLSKLLRLEKKIKKRGRNISGRTIQPRSETIIYRVYDLEGILLKIAKFKIKRRGCVTILKRIEKIEFTDFGFSFYCTSKFSGKTRVTNYDFLGNEL